jgi:hypothetical protein
LLRRRPRSCVQPLPQLGLRRGLGEVAVAVLALDLAGVLAVRRLPPRVVRQTPCVGDAKLVGDPERDGLGHVGRPRQKRAEVADGAKLHGEPEPVVIAAMTADQRAIAIVEVKEPIQLRRRRRAGVAAIAGKPLAAQELVRDRAARPPVRRRRATPRCRGHGQRRRLPSRPAAGAAADAGTGWCAGPRSS